MRPIAIGCLVLTLASSASGQAPAAPTAPQNTSLDRQSELDQAAAEAAKRWRFNEPTVQVGVFLVRPDGSDGGRAWEDGKLGEEFSAAVATNGCAVSAGSREFVSSVAQSGRDTWEFRARVVSQTADRTVVEVTWRRVRSAGTAVNQSQQSTLLTLALDERVTLDTSAPDPQTSCVSSIFGARYSRPLPTSMNVVAVGPSRYLASPDVPGFDAELWLVHGVPGRPETVLPARARLAGGTAAFDFAPMVGAAPGGSLSVHVKGRLRVLGGQGGKGQLIFEAERDVTFSPSTRPPRDSIGRDPEGKAVVTRPLPGPDDVLEFEMPALNVRGLPKLPDVFSVRVRLRPSAQQAGPELKPELANATAITLRFRNARLTDALKLIQSASGIAIQIAPEVTDTPNVNATFKNARFKDVVTTLLMPSGLTFRALDEKTILVMKASK